MAKVILVTGGARSGKSDYALALAEALPSPRVYVATCPVTDEEMRKRIARHQRDRGNDKWQTVEETVDLKRVLSELPTGAAVLVDCLTLWVNNLLFTEDKARAVSEDMIRARSEELLAACAKREGTVIFVTNEVGSGIVPENALARRYRDLVGRCNQTLAAGADEVTLVSCGLPLHFRKG